MSPTPIKHYLQFSDLGADEYAYLLDRARILKAKFKNYETWHPLHDRTLAMIFEKNSTRTRLSFEAGVHQLGGHAVFLNTRDSQLGRGEPTENSRGFRFGNHNQSMQILVEEIQGVWTGQQTAQQALDNAAARGNEVLRQYEQLHAGQ